MAKTMRYCPYCGRGATRVRFEGHTTFTRLGRFVIECGEGHISDVYWPDEDHDDDCECELHDEE